MTGPELFAEALRLRQEARDQYEFPSEEWAQAMAEAHLCATLADVAVKAETAHLVTWESALYGGAS